MSSETISSNTEIASAAAQLLTQQLNDYCSFSVSSIEDTAQVEGSNIHKDVGAQIEKALTAWHALLQSDADAINNADAAFKGLDSSIASNFLGMGGQS